MKPRKKQRIEEPEENHNEARGKNKAEEKNRKKQKPVEDEPEMSEGEVEGLDEIIDDEDDLPGTLL